MNYKYLQTGMEVVIEEETENSFFVRPVLTAEAQDYEGRYEEIEVYGDMIKVAKTQLFDKAPTEKYDSEIEAKKQKLEELKKETLAKSEELSKIKQEIYRDNLTKVSNEKFIINRSEIMNAESIAFFKKYSIAPIILGSDKVKGLKLMTTIELRTGEENNWVYTLYFDEWGYSDYIDKSGILVNPTEENLIELALKRQESKIYFSDAVIMSTPEKYLSIKNKIKRTKLLEDKKEKEIENSKNKIEKLKKDLQHAETELHLNQQKS